MFKEPANQNAFSATTRGIRVIAQPFYLEEQSVPDRSQFVWAYRIEIINDGDEVVRLESRTWSITDAKGITQEVHGPGVVGEFPRLVSEAGDHFDIEIPLFSLDSPFSTGRLN
jgi:ApaG protein